MHNFDKMLLMIKTQNLLRTTNTESIGQILSSQNIFSHAQK